MSGIPGHTWHLPLGWYEKGLFPPGSAQIGSWLLNVRCSAAENWHFWRAQWWAWVRNRKNGNHHIPLTKAEAIKTQPRRIDAGLAQVRKTVAETTAFKELIAAYHWLWGVKTWEGWAQVGLGSCNPAWNGLSDLGGWALEIHLVTGSLHDFQLRPVVMRLPLAEMPLIILANKWFGRWTLVVKRLFPSFPGSFWLTVKNREGCWFRSRGEINVWLGKPLFPKK